MATSLHIAQIQVRFSLPSFHFPQLVHPSQVTLLSFNKLLKCASVFDRVV